MVELGGDKREAILARHVLERLAGWRPIPRDVDAAAFDLDSAESNRALLAIMESLCDEGLVMYEAIVVRAGTPCFRDAVITTSGYAALQTMRRNDPAATR